MDDLEEVVPRRIHEEREAVGVYGPPSTPAPSPLPPPLVTCTNPSCEDPNLEEGCIYLQMVGPRELLWPPLCLTCWFNLGPAERTRLLREGGVWGEEP